ncbi:GNAT family N-acetyltransferase [Bacteroides sp. KG123]|uniref:GNAT family N-acetyltransferase n=1 Tax=unclassified Bacteroides TaxID=2646097 RepID=UPI003D7F399A
MIAIRRTRSEEADVLTDVFGKAKRIMRESGNMRQWTGNYPSKEIIVADIENGNSYVCTDNAGEIIGTFAFIRGNEPTYTHIHEGEWVDNTSPYGVIHRLASTGACKGVAHACLQWCYEQMPNLRADTHRDNHILQHILKKHGFRYCGIIYLANGDERLAFQKI